MTEREPEMSATLSADLSAEFMELSLVDIGVNLTNQRFQSDLLAVLARAAESRVLDIIITGVDLESSREALALCQRADELAPSGLRLWCTAGVHPHDSGQVEAGYLDALRALHSTHPDLVVAVGECGLDYERDYSPRPKQRACFEAQLALASELERPLFLHERGAHEDLYAMLKSAGAEVARRSVVHCFTGQGHEMERYLSLGCSIGITGWVCDERRGLELKRIVSASPLNRLLVETDAPYLTPRSLRPKPKRGRNEPATLPHIVTELARYMGKQDVELWRASTENATRLFGLPAREASEE